MATSLGALQTADVAFERASTHPTLPKLVTDAEAVGACASLLTLACVLSAAPASTRPLAAAPLCYLWSRTGCMMPETPRPSPLAITPISLHF